MSRLCGIDIHPHFSSVASERPSRRCFPLWRAEPERNDIGQKAPRTTNCNSVTLRWSQAAWRRVEKRNDMSFVRPSLKHHLTTWEAPSDWDPASDTGMSLAFHYGRERGVLLEGVDEPLLLLLSLLDGQHTFSDIVARLQARWPEVTEEDVADNLEELRQHGLIEDAAVEPPTDLTEVDLNRYARQILFFSALDSSGVQKYDMQARLKRARVAILGLGGLGCNVALGLAAAGVGYMRGVDFDVVELSNLNRQTLYDTGDLGQPKARAAAEQIRRFNPEIDFEPIECRIEGEEQLAGLFGGVDLIVQCADIPSHLPQWVNRVALRTGKPFLGGSYQGAVADIGPFVVPYRTSCLACHRVEHHPVPELLAWTRDRAWRSHPNVHFVTATAANLVCAELIKHITGFARPMTYNTRYLLSVERFTLDAVEMPRNRDCPACGIGANPQPDTQGVDGVDAVAGRPAQ